MTSTERRAEPRINRIYVGVNETVEAAAALRWSLDLASVVRAEVTVVEAVEPRQSERSPEWEIAFKIESARQLESWVDGLDIETSARVVAVEGRPTTVLPLVSRELDAKAVVIGSRPYEGATSLGLGSLAHALAHDLESPLVAVPERSVVLEGGCLVVGVDESASSRVALCWAEELAATLGAQVFAVHCIERDGRPLADAPSGTGSAELVELVSDHPAESLREVAADHNAGLIVVAARERHSLGGRLLGAVPDRLLHHPTRPVAILPHSLAHAA